MTFRVAAQNLFVMSSNETTITPAQAKLLEFVQQNQPYESLHTTLSLSIGNYCADGDASVGGPMPATASAWYFALELLDVLRRIELETAAQKTLPEGQVG